MENWRLIMSRDEVKYYIDHMDANGLLNLCNDINE